MIHKACMPVFMTQEKLLRTDGWTDREIESSTRGPRGPKNVVMKSLSMK